MDEHDELAEGVEDLPEADAGVVEEAEQDAPEPQEEIGAGGAEPEEEFTAVDLNTASEEELQQLPGIGETLAARIVSYRQGVQPFREAAEITLVPGVSQATYERIAHRLVVSPAEVPPIPELEEAEAEAAVEEVELAEPEPEAAADEVELAEPEPEAAEVEEVPPEPEVVEAAAEPARPKPEPLPWIMPEPVRGGGHWGRLLFTGLVSAVIGAALALLILWLLNGTLDFGRAADVLRTEIYRLEGDAETLRVDLGQVQGRLDDLQELAPRLEEAQGAIQYLMNEMGAMQDQVGAALDGLEETQRTLVTLEDQVAGMGEGLFRMEEAVGAMEEQVAGMGEEIELLHQATARFDAFLEGLRALLNETATLEEGVTPPQGGGLTPTPWVTRTPWEAPTPTPWETPTPKSMVTVIPLSTPTPTP